MPTIFFLAHTSRPPSQFGSICLQIGKRRFLIARQFLVHRLDHPPNTLGQLLHVLVGRGIGLRVSQVSLDAPGDAVPCVCSTKAFRLQNGQGFNSGFPPLSAIRPPVPCGDCYIIPLFPPRVAPISVVRARNVRAVRDEESPGAIIGMQA